MNQPAPTSDSITEQAARAEALRLYPERWVHGSVSYDDNGGKRALFVAGAAFALAHQAPATEDGSSTREDYTVALIAEGPTQSLTWPTAAGARAWLDSAQRGADGPKFPNAVVLHRVTTLREVTP